jgi:DNA-binding MarR family transcriptional regulator
LKEPNELEAAILVAVKEGIDDIEDLTESLALPADAVAGVVTKLVRQGVLEVKEKNILLVKRRVLGLTEKGYAMIPQAYNIVKKYADEAMKRWGEEKTLNEKLRMLIPFFQKIGLINDYVAREIIEKEKIDVGGPKEDVEAVEKASNIDLK